MVLSRKRTSALRETFVAVRYSKPYQSYPDDVFNAKCITHIVVGPKPSPDAERPKTPFQHFPGVGFARGMLYVIRTDRDAVDKKMHDYYVYIGASSESEEELKSILTDKTRIGELSWPHNIEDTSELESGCESDDKATRAGQLLQEAKHTAKEQRNARQQSHQDHLKALRNTSHFDLLGPNSSTLLDDHTGLTIENLRKRAEEQAELIKKMEEESQRREEEERRRAEELSQKEDDLRKKEEELNSNIKRMDSVFVCIQNLQKDVSLIKEKLSGSSIASGSTSSSYQEEDIWDTYHGLKIRRRNIPGLEEAQKDPDFLKTLLKGCFGKEAKNMRTCHSKGTTKLTDTWMTEAAIVYGHWLKHIKKVDGLPLSLKDIEIAKKNFKKSVGDAARSLCPARGVNLVKQEARDKGLSKEEVQAAAEAYQAARPKRPAEASGGRPPKPKKKNTKEVASVEATVTEGLPSGSGSGSGSGPAPVQGESWEHIDPTFLGAGPSGPTVTPVSHTENIPD